MQVRHAVYCKLCKDTVESKSIHNFVTCACGSASVDGGIDSGNRIIGDRKNMELRSIYAASINGKNVWLFQDVVDKQFN